MNKKEYIKSDELIDSTKFKFNQAVSTPAGKMIFISGQTAMNKNMEIVGKNDFKAQAEQSFKNLGIVLDAAGATPADITMMHVFVVNYKPECALTLGPILKGFFKGTPYPAQSMFGVQCLILPDFMIEIEAIAVIHE